MLPSSAPLLASTKLMLKAPLRELPVALIVVVEAVLPGATLSTTFGENADRPDGRPDVVNPTLTGFAADVWILLTMALAKLVGSTFVSKTSGFPLASVASVRRAMLDSQVEDELPPGPSALVGASPGPMPRTLIPSALRAFTVS